MKKILTLGLALVLCMCSLVLPAFAADGVGYGTAVDGATFNRGSSTTTGSLTDNTGSYSGYYGDIAGPDEVLGMNDGNKVTTNDVDNWVSRKGNDLIRIITRGVQIIAVIGFFGALFMIVVGAIGDKRTMVAGLIALLVACLVFTAATCAPQILSAVRGWLIT